MGIIPGEESAVDLVEEHPFPTDLRRDDHQHPESQRQQQTQCALEEERPAGSCSQGESDSRTRNEEQQRQVPAIEEDMASLSPSEVSALSEKVQTVLAR